MNPEVRPWPLDFQVADAPRQFSIFFLAYEFWSSCPWVMFVVFHAFELRLARFLFFF